MCSSNSSEWITETPKEPEYILGMIDYDNTCKPLQEVRVTRDEYVELKRYLGVLRGILPARDLDKSLLPRSTWILSKDDAGNLEEVKDNLQAIFDNRS